jgi:mRNA interferase MazF
MERLVKGDVIVTPFPFTDLSSSKKKPALILARLKGDDLICIQITSEDRCDTYSLILTKMTLHKDNFHKQVWYDQIDYLQQIKILFVTK